MGGDYLTLHGQPPLKCLPRCAACSYYRQATGAGVISAVVLIHDAREAIEDKLVLVIEVALALSRRRSGWKGGGRLRGMFGAITPGFDLPDFIGDALGLEPRTH